MSFYPALFLMIFTNMSLVRNIEVNFQSYISSFISKVKYINLWKRWCQSFYVLSNDIHLIHHAQLFQECGLNLYASPFKFIMLGDDHENSIWTLNFLEYIWDFLSFIWKSREVDEKWKIKDNVQVSMTNT